VYWHDITNKNLMIQWYFLKENTFVKQLEKTSKIQTVIFSSCFLNYRDFTLLFPGQWITVKTISFMQNQIYVIYIYPWD
jgi:hypothetical protein